jgi:hypothetical protein
MNNSVKKTSRQVKYPKGDKIALSIGIILTLLALAFFIWKMSTNLSKDWSLKAVPASTPTPPLESLKKG